MPHLTDVYFAKCVKTQCLFSDKRARPGINEPANHRLQKQQRPEKRTVGDRGNISPVQPHNCCLCVNDNFKLLIQMCPYKTNQTVTQVSIHIIN